MFKRLSPLAVLATLSVGCVVTGSGQSKTEGRPITNFDGIESTDLVNIEVRAGARQDGVDVTCDDNLLDILETEVKDGVLAVGFPNGMAVMSRTTCKLVTGNTQLIEVASSGSGDISITGPAWPLESVRTSGSGDVTIQLRGEFTADATESEDTSDEASGLLDEGEDSGGDLLEGSDSSESGLIALPAASELDISTTGSGDVRIEGIELNKVFLTTTGSGDVHLSGDATKLDAKSTGSGDVGARELHTDRVDLLTTGSGDMTAHARQAASVKTTGSGDVTVYGNPGTRDRNSTGSGDIRFR